MATPEKWLVDWFKGGGNTQSGIAVDEESAQTYSAVFGATRLISNSLGIPPLKIFKRLPDGGREPAVDHPLYNFFRRRPNPNFTSFRFRQTMQGYLTLWGNAYAYKMIDGRGRLESLTPLYPGRMKVGLEGGKRTYNFTLSNGTQRNLTQDQVLHIAGFGTDGIVGKSVVQLARESIGYGLAIQTFGSRFFGSGTHPSGMFEHPGRLGPDAHKNLRDDIAEKYQGLGRSHEFLLLEEGMKYQPVGIPPNDAQFLESGKFSVNDIARWFSVPPHKIGDLDRATFSNIEEQNIDYINDTMLAWYILWEQELETQLLPEEDWEDHFIEFVLEGLLRGDIKSRYEAYVLAKRNGWMNGNEIRQKENMNPMGDKGDIYTIEMNMVDLSQISDMPPDPSAARAISGKEQRQQRSVRGRNKVKDNFRGLFEDAAGRIVRREGIAVGKAVKRYLKENKFSDFRKWTANFYEKDLPVHIKRSMMPVMMAYAEGVQREAGKEVSAPIGMTPELEVFTKQYQETFNQRYITASTGQIDFLIDQEPPEDLTVADVVETRLNGWGETRAGQVANREVVQMGNAVAVSVFASAGVTYLRWINQGSETCPFCEGLHNKVVGIEGTFVSSGEDFKPAGADEPMHVRGAKRHPPLHQGCDCIIVAG